MIEWVELNGRMVAYGAIEDIYPGAGPTTKKWLLENTFIRDGKEFVYGFKIIPKGLKIT